MRGPVIDKLITRGHARGSVPARMVPGKPALVLEEDGRHLVVSDVHIGFESQMGGIFVGKSGIAEQAAAEISDIMDAEGARSLVLLGDTKSGTGSITDQEWEQVPDFLERLAARYEVALVPGNHDAGIERLAPRGVRMTGPSGLVLGGTLLTHGHALPPPSYSHVGRVVAGHVHPAYRDPDSILDGSRVWVWARVPKRNLFPAERGALDLALMPAFNEYMRPGRSRGSSPVTRRMRGISEARIVTLDGSLIGGADQLQHVI